MVLDHEIRRDTPDVLVKDPHGRGHVELLEIQERKVPGVVRMDRTCAGRKQRQEGLHAREPLAHAALADEHVGKSVLRPRVSRLERERAFRARFRNRVVGAQLAREGGHGEKIGIAGMYGFEPVHICAEARAHVLLAEHVVEKLRELRREQVARPQVVVGLPERERPIKRALARIHG